MKVNWLEINQAVDPMWLYQVEGQGIVKPRVEAPALTYLERVALGIEEVKVISELRGVRWHNFTLRGRGWISITIV